MNKYLSVFFLLLFVSTRIFAQDNKPVLDITLSNYQYPYEVHYLDFESQGKQLKMAYMDVQPSMPNGKIVMLLHGKNFNGAYWKTTIEALTKEGYRVIVPDQIGFGKSSKPIGYQFTFQQLAQNTKMILDKIQINKLNLLGHSMGGMLATRFALMYPEMVERLILENPIGLEDWKLVVPYSTIDENYISELKAGYESTKQYQTRFYYDNQWKPEYDEWVYLLTGWVKHPDYPIVAMNNAQTSDMVFTQPVIYEFRYIKAPTLLIIGTRDRTAIGKDKVKDESVREKMGLYQNLGKQTRDKISNSKLVELDNVGHLPHIEAFDRFIKPLMDFIE
ncbi:pimeloyl-ACP methyl ester carboxylesterase [Dysgonomonas hofstadii]|uniref:Pimeloyl-ACP methyl ester carboxylesterase n=1 Tax=Dysgonomonas hofstadii TaxID=637886 RepID=A0A840CPI6_9BACT|nr:alpha/beta hydrolase [Dysgonomonas hofstadii]MBB4035474.1 pimeloyl-ACP methyl ester carboxylesterase [Dysgonomonas hofstadii]